MEMCSESGYGVVDGVGGRMEYLRDGIRLELESEKVVGKGVPLQLACPYQEKLLTEHSTCPCPH